MESPLSVFFRMHWDHEPETRKPFRIKASVFRFMERLLRLEADCSTRIRRDSPGTDFAFATPVNPAINVG